MGMVVGPRGRTSSLTPRRRPHKRKIVLASASPRRRDILAMTGLAFVVDPSDYEEDMSIDLEPNKLARFLSLQKARHVAGKYNDALVISADTFIVLQGRVLGKPANPGAALLMLRLLNGTTHTVITGFTVLDTASGRGSSGSVETRVTFKRLTIRELSSYIRTGEPLDKAGAYAIQGLGALLVEKIEGDYLNVIGLPLSALADSLKKFGVRLL